MQFSASLIADCWGVRVKLVSHVENMEWAYNRRRYRTKEVMSA